MDEHKLHAIPLFASLTGPQLRDVAQHADEVDVSEGKPLLREGAFAYEFMVIESGQAEVTRASSHRDQVAFQYVAGDHHARRLTVGRPRQCDSHRDIVPNLEPRYTVREQV